MLWWGADSDACSAYHFEMPEGLLAGDRRRYGGRTAIAWRVTQSDPFSPPLRPILAYGCVLRALHLARSIRAVNDA